MESAFWVKKTPDSYWNLWVAVNARAEDDLRAAYARLAAEWKPGSAVQLSRVAVVRSTDFPVAALALARADAPDGRLIVLRPELVDALKPTGWHQVVLYPKFGPMNAAEVAACLTRELNRVGPPVTVTLNLSDGQAVRGFPLAIRKSPLGGALVELADPETRVKGRDVTLDHIYSVVPDQLSS